MRLKKLLCTTLSLCMAISLIPCAQAKEAEASEVSYQPITITSSNLNGNAVWGLGETFTTVKSAGGLDNYAAFFTEKNDRGVGGTPTDGKFQVGEVPYQMGWTGSSAYDGEDCIRLTSATKTKTMELQTIGAYKNIFVLATAGGPGTGYYADFSVTLNYTDGTKEDTTYKLYDWYDGTTVPNVTKYSNICRYELNGQAYDGSVSAGPYLHSAAITANPAKLLSSISFTMNGKGRNNTIVDASGSGLYCGIFGVTGATADGAPTTPTGVKADTVTETSFDVSWDAVDSATGYTIDVATDENFTQVLPDYNNKAVTGTTTPISGLTKDTKYYYRVRATNDLGSSLSSDAQNIITTGGVQPSSSPSSSQTYGAVTLTSSEDNLQLADENVIATKGEDATVTLQTKGDNIELPDAINVKVGGTSLTDGYTYDKETGVIKVNGDKIDGAVIIEANAVPATVETYDVTTPSGNLKATGEVVTGKDAVITLAVDDNHKLPDAIVVKVNGTPITDGYTYDKTTGKVVVDKAKVTGPITIEAVVPGKTETVTTTGSDVKVSGDVRYGEDAVLTLTPQTGYDYPESVVVKVDGTALTTGYTYDKTTGKITVSKEKVTGAITVETKAKAKTYNSTSTNSNVSVTGDVVYGQDAVLTVTAGDGYDLPEAVVVKCGDKILTAGTDYTYDKTTGKIVVKAASVTGPITVNAAAVKDNTSSSSTSIELNIPSITMKKVMGLNKKFKVKMLNSKGASINVYSSNKKVATVSKKGVIKTTGKAGKAKIVVNVTKGKYKVQYIIKVTSTKKVKKNYSLVSYSTKYKHPTFAIYKQIVKGSKYEVKFAHIKSSAKIKYTTTNKKVASVSKKGVIKGKKVGRANICATIKQGGKTYCYYLGVRVSQAGKKSSMKGLKVIK